MTAQATLSKSEQSMIPWWLVLIQGIAAILIGFFLLTSPATTTFVIIQFLGFYWLISGIFGIISIFFDRRMWGWKLIAGLLGILAGVLIIQNPLWSTVLVPTTLIIVLGIEGLIIGVINLIQAFRGGGWGIGVLGVLSILFGLVLLGNPFLAALGLPIILGILGIVFGVIAIFGAFRIRNVEKEAKQALQATPVTRAGAVPAVETMVAKTEAAGAGVVSSAGAGVAAAGAGAAAAGATAFAAAESVVEETKEKPVDVAEDVSDKVEDIPEKVAEVTGDVVEKVGDVAEGGVDTVSAGVAGAVAAVAGAVDDIVPDIKLGDLDFSDLDENAKFGYALEYIEGIGPAFAEKLHAIGVTTIRAFFERGATSKGRDELAELSGISGKLILEWINHVDLYRIKGVGSEYADLLEAAGVDTVVELANRNPTNLFNKLVAVNEEKNLVRRTPVESQVKEWVDQAKTLPRKVMY
jgi:uncharacterized membrane protein HdeD (DUF308 family)/predicted flap endonuclease-1-like 5' DNA nuclease